MNNQRSLENLQSCKAAVDTYNATLETNKVIAEYNSGQSAAAGAAKTAWDQRRINKENEIKSWNDNKNNVKRDLMNEENRMGLGACGSNKGCEGGWHWYKNDNRDWLCEQVCQRNEDTAEREASSRVGNPPGAFNEGEPRDKEGSYAHKTQIENNSNIQCCANIMNVADATSVTQSCSQAINSILENPSTIEPTGLNDATGSTGSIIERYFPSLKDYDKKYIYGAFLCAFLLLCLCSCSLVIFALYYDYTSDM